MVSFIIEETRPVRSGLTHTKVPGCLLDRRLVALAHRLQIDPSERRVNLLADALLLSADGFQIAGRGFQV
jgi:hypothetical protein